MSTKTPERSEARLRDIIRFEWVKLWSVESSVLTLLIAVIGPVAVGLGLCYYLGTDTGFLRDGIRAGMEPVSTSMQGIYISLLALGTLGVTSVSGEYSTGTIRSTFLAAPRRGAVVLAKAITYGVVVTTLMLLPLSVAYVGGQLLLDLGDLGADIWTLDAWRTVLTTALYATLTTLLGMGFGWLMRDTAGAVTSLLGTFVLLPAMLVLVPEPWSGRLISVLPVSLGRSLTSTEGSVPVWLALGGMVLWAGALLVLGWRRALKVDP